MISLKNLNVTQFRVTRSLFLLAFPTLLANLSLIFLDYLQDLLWGQPGCAQRSDVDHGAVASCQDEATKVNLFTQERNGILSQAVEAVDGLGGIIF